MYLFKRTHRLLCKVNTFRDFSRTVGYDKLGLCSPASVEAFVLVSEARMVIWCLHHVVSYARV